MGVLGRDPGQEKVGCKWAVEDSAACLVGVSLRTILVSQKEHIKKKSTDFSIPLPFQVSQLFFK